VAKTRGDGYVLPRTRHPMMMVVMSTVDVTSRYTVVYQYRGISVAFLDTAHP